MLKEAHGMTEIPADLVEQIRGGLRSLRLTPVG